VIFPDGARVRAEVADTEATRLEVYGPRPLARLVIVGESLVFQEGDGRPRMLPKPSAEAGS